MDEIEAKRRIEESRRTLARSSFNLRHCAFLASALALVGAVLVLWGGLSSNAQARHLIADGRLVQGTELRQDSSSDDDSTCFTRIIGYVVNGKHYTTESECVRSNSSGPVIEETVVALPRLGPEDVDQIVYLPSDPSVAHLRDELTLDMFPYYAGGGFCGLFGLIFGLVAWKLLGSEG